MHSLHKIRMPRYLHTVTMQYIKVTLRSTVYLLICLVVTSPDTLSLSQAQKSNYLPQSCIISKLRFKVMWLPYRFSLLIREKTDKSSRRTEEQRISGQLSTQEEVKKYSALRWIEDLFFPFLMEEVVGSCSSK